MLEILKFIFSSFWTWAGSVVLLVLILATCGTIAQGIAAVTCKGRCK